MAAALAWVMRACAVIALATLVIEFGYDVPPEHVRTLQVVELGVAVAFAADVLLRLLFARDRRAHFRRRWPELVLVALVAAGVPLFAEGATLVRVYVVAAQAYVIAVMVLAAVRANERLALRIRPAVLLVGSFVLMITVGAFLLLTPRARTQPWSVVDAVFMSTSAACVTGLAVRDIGTDLTMRGQAVVFGLIQTGGLGIVTIAMFVTYLSRRSLRLQQMTALREILSVQSLGQLGRFLAYTLVITVGVELAGAAVLFHARSDLAPGPRVWWSVFHAVSAFCNAGFSLSSTSLMPWAGSAQIVLTVALLIVLGGIGFPVLLDLLRFDLGSLGFVRRWRWQPSADLGPRTRLSLHTKLVVVTTALLVVSGAFLFHVSEADRALVGQTPARQLLTSVFQSVTARTAGFNTVNIALLQPPTLLLLMVLMVVGASPASAGGGVKTSTVAVLWLTVRSMIRGREHVEAFGRSLPRTAVNTSVAIVALYAAAAVLTTALLLASQDDVRFLDAAFESISALSTVGLSMGLTPQLNDFGKIVISAAMLVGRVGPLAILWTLMARPPALRYEYPEEPIVVS